MSQQYRMDVFLKNVEERKVDAVIAAAEALWPFEGMWCRFHPDGQAEGHVNIDNAGTSSLHSGEQPEEFSDRLAKAVWGAHGGFCEVEVYSAYDDFGGKEEQEPHILNIEDFLRLTRQRVSR